jgi:hypothetical protein
VTLELPADAFGPTAHVVLRVGLMAPQEGETYTVWLNGAERPLAATALQDLPADDLLRPGTNIIEVTARGPEPNPARALGFVSAVVRREG